MRWLPGINAGAHPGIRLIRGNDNNLEQSSITRPGDEFTALDAGEAEVVAPGEVAYASGNVILTRHFIWRQARW